MKKKTSSIKGFAIAFLIAGLALGTMSMFTETAYFQADVFTEVLDPLGDKDPGGLPSRFSDAPEGRNIISAAIDAITDYWKSILGFLATLMIVYAGVRIVTSDDENTISENKNIILWIFVGLAVVLLADVGVRKVLFGEEFFTNPEGVFTSPETIAAAAKAGSFEIAGIINWLKTVLGSVAVFMIMLTTTRLLLNFGDEENIGRQREMLFAVGFGLVMLALNQVAVETIYNPTLEVSGQTGVVSMSPDLDKGIRETAGFINYILGFVALFAFGSLIYGGFWMVYNWGDEQAVEVAKRILWDAVLGLVLIFTAYAIIATMIIGDTSRIFS